MLPRGSLILIWKGSNKQCKSMVKLRDLPRKFVHCPGWCHIKYNDPCASYIGKFLFNLVEIDCQDGKQGEKEERERGGAKNMKKKRNSCGVILLFYRVLVIRWCTSWNTLPETNIAPENGWLEDAFPFGKPYLQGRAVSFREGITQMWEIIRDDLWNFLGWCLYKKISQV